MLTAIHKSVPRIRVVAAWSAFMIFMGAGAFAIGMAIHNEATAKPLSPSPEPIYYCATGEECSSKDGRGAERESQPTPNIVHIPSDFYRQQLHTNIWKIKRELSSFHQISSQYVTNLTLRDTEFVASCKSLDLDSLGAMTNS